MYSLRSSSDPVADAAKDSGVPDTLYAFETHLDVGIPGHDGVRLSANLWLPAPRTAGECFPVILEMLPYRKDDYRLPEDQRVMGYFAARGFACCRLDVRGTGNSEGIAVDEYSDDETRDGCAAVAWLAMQPWSTGAVGMSGRSYSGFVAIQVAMQRPPALRAIAPMYASDNRYTDDVHYLGGCLMASDSSHYAISQAALNAFPPDVGALDEAGRARWRARLEDTSPWVLGWLREQVDGPTWWRGSLQPDYSRISCPMLLIAGWMDAYTDSALRMLAHCTASRRVLLGNWSHTPPDTGYPGPAMDWLAELARFFAHHLRGEDNGEGAQPALRWFQREYSRPEPFPARLSGFWAARDDWLPEGSAQKVLRFGQPENANAIPRPLPLQLPHSATHGMNDSLCWGAGSPPFGLARDLRDDDGALHFTGEALTQALDILGVPSVSLRVSVDAPVAHLVARLCDVAPDGSVAVVTRGVLNLTRRHGMAVPCAINPGELMDITLCLKATGYRFLPGHRIRLSVSSSWWPVLWPSPYPATLSLYVSGDAAPCLRLPLPDHVTPCEPPLPPPAGDTFCAPGEHDMLWKTRMGGPEGEACVEVGSFDVTCLPDGTRVETGEHVILTANAKDPSVAQLRNRVRYALVNAAHAVAVDLDADIRSDRQDLHVALRLHVRLDGQSFFAREWHERITRQLL